MEKCYENLIKYFVFLCNLLFALAGACLVGFGAFVQINANDFKEFVGSSYVIISTFVIVVGRSSIKKNCSSITSTPDMNIITIKFSTISIRNIGRIVLLSQFITIYYLCPCPKVLYKYTSPPGLITFFISFLGCCGSCNENSCLVCTQHCTLPSAHCPLYSKW